MATDKAVIRFRCYRCNKLLGTSPSRAGKTTTCPNCQAELIVPEPEDNEKSALAEATRSLVPDLDDAPRVVERDRDPDTSPQHDPSFSWEELDTAIFQAPGGPAPIDLPISFAPPEPSPEPEPEPSDEPPPPSPPVVGPSAPGPAAAVPEITVETAPIVVDRARRRRPGEVVLTQSVITSWAAFMLLALGISFVAGVVVGHFVWKSP
jgi:phage FluMu protein Com